MSIDSPLGSHDVLEEEYEALHGALPAEYKKFKEELKNSKKTDREINEALISQIYKYIHRLPQKRSALCISGGGIRSGTFALGIMQGLARCGCLDRFDYLSTVSGGGYIGSWLSSWIHHDPKGEEGVVQALSKEPTSKLEPEPPPVSHLRDYSNYLSPKLGLLSADTWTLVAIYTRNLLLNWLVLIPMLAAVLMLPRIYSAIIGHIKVAKLNQPLNPATDLLDQYSLVMTGLLIAGFILGGLAIGYIGLNRPSSSKSNTTQGRFIRLCLVPMVLSSVFITIYWMWYRTKGGAVISFRYFVLFGIWVNLLGFLFSFLVRSRGLRGLTKSDARNAFFELLAVLFTGTVGGCLIGLFATASFFVAPEGGPDADEINRRVYICFAFPVLLSILVLTAMLFVGIISFYTSDEDREWLSRSDAWFLIAILGWAAAGLLVIYGPLSLGYLQDQISSTGIASIGGVSGLITILLGSSASTGVTEKQKEEGGWKTRVPDIALKLAAPIFVIFLLILLVLAVSEVIKFLNGSQLSAWLGRTFSLNLHLPVENPVRHDHFDHLMVVYYSPLWVVISLMVCLLLISGTMAFFININRFSLHAMYRNRLIRAYLGASNTKRNPNRFTGFDPNDNIRMHELWPLNEAKVPRKKLLHVINMALNLVGGDKLAWQQRKAESFTVSPLHAGSYSVGYRRSKEYGGKEGISLGTSVAISGAAASPNMGYNSSPVITFLMTLFNARLGWWLGNTGKAGNKTYPLEGPYFAVRPLIDETLGLTNDRNPYIYLSDGGHFENLGLYEMVLRRCHFIVVSDGSEDEQGTFGSLGNAVRKIRIDLGVPIEFDEDIKIYSRAQGEKGKYLAIGRIRYSCIDGSGTDGILVYFKPAFYGDEPRDIYEYARMNPKFPHETTGDQFFTESQFESYRMLGSHIMEKVLGERYAASDLNDLLRKSAAHLYPAPPRPRWLEDWLNKI